MSNFPKIPKKGQIVKYKGKKFRATGVKGFGAWRITK